MRQKLFRDAERQFTSCRTLNPYDEYGYHSHAEMLKDMRQYEIADDDQKDAWLLRALQITSEGLARIPLQKRVLVRDLHNSLLAEWGQLGRAREYFRTRVEAGAGPDTHCLWGRVELEAGQGDRALEISTKALRKWPDNPVLVALAGDCAGKIMNSTGKVDVTLLGYLRRSADMLSDRADLRLRYAVALYIARQFDQISTGFTKARNSLPENISPTVTRHKWVDNQGNARRFHRKAIERDAKWTVEAPGLPLVYLSPRYAQDLGIRPGQPITFEIGFNYIGALAMNVKAEM